MTTLPSMLGTARGRIFACHKKAHQVRCLRRFFKQVLMAERERIRFHGIGGDNSSAFGKSLVRGFAFQLVGVGCKAAAPIFMNTASSRYARFHKSPRLRRIEWIRVWCRGTTVHDTVEGRRGRLGARRSGVPCSRKRLQFLRTPALDNSCFRIKGGHCNCAASSWR